MNRQNAFLILWMLFFGVIFGVVFFFGLNQDLNIPTKYVWITKLMFYYLYFACVRTIALLGLSFYEYLTNQSRVTLKAPPLVTIIIPCYNEGVCIKDSIRSVLKLNYPNFEVLVVDDGSKDDTFENAVAMTTNFRVRVISKNNGGKSSALNYGIQQALGDYVLCLDADSELDVEVLNRGVPYFDYNPNLAAVAGSTRVGNSRSLLGLFQKLEYIIGLNFHKKAQSALNMVTIIPGPIGLFKKKVLLEVGGYDVDTFAEDCDLTLKILTKGYHVKYCSDMIVYTEVPQTFSDLTIQRYRWSRGMIQAIVKNVAQMNFQSENKTRSFLILFYMVIETMLIPSINFLFCMMTLILALAADNVNLYGPFFAGLVLMDATIAIYSIFTEKKFAGIFFLSIISRVTYGLALEIMRFYAMLDEIFKIPMKWGTIKRQGMK